MSRPYVTNDQIREHLDKHPTRHIADVCKSLGIGAVRVREMMAERYSKSGKPRKQLRYLYDGVSYRLPAERLPVGGSFVVEVVS